MYVYASTSVRMSSPVRPCLTSPSMHQCDSAHCHVQYTDVRAYSFGCKSHITQVSISVGPSALQILYTEKCAFARLLSSNPLRRMYRCARQCVCLSVCPSVCLPACLSVCMSVWLSACLSVFLSAVRSACFHAYMHMLRCTCMCYACLHADTPACLNPTCRFYRRHVTCSKFRGAARQCNMCMSFSIWETPCPVWRLTAHVMAFE